MPAPLTGPVLAAAVVLALAAPAKLRRPALTGNALAALGLPSSRELVRALGVGELVLAGWVLVAPSAPALALLAAAYAAFAGFVAAALRRGTPLASCGCFGRPDTPPTRTHLVLVLGAGLACAAAALGAAGAVAALGTGASPVQHVVADGAWWGAPLLASVAVLTWLAWVALAVLPRVADATRGAPSRAAAAR